VDLCAQDKSKIGELVKKLTSESKLRQDSEQRFNQEKQSFDQKLKEMEARSLQFEAEREAMKQKLDKSLAILKDMKQSHAALATSKTTQAEELLALRQELVQAR
jgi:predicted phage gp36 major capsid-like protein